MIGLVLDDSRGEILELELEALAGAIERRDLDVLRAGHAAAHFRNAEAAFPTLDRLIADDGNLGIDEGNRIALAASVGIEHRHENPQALVHLRGREPDARILVHRVDHAVDELLDGGVLELALVHGPRLGAKDGVAHSSNFQNRHE